MLTQTINGNLLSNNQQRRDITQMKPLLFAIDDHFTPFKSFILVDTN